MSGLISDIVSRAIILKANGTFNDIRRVNMLGAEREQCAWPSKCESFMAAPTAIIGISPATSI
jgi:hypothetical protein